MRLVVLSSEFPPGPGGIGTHAYEVSRHLTARGWACHCVLTSQDHASTEEIDEFNASQPFRVIRFRPVSNSPMEAAYRITLAARWIGKLRPDIILATGQRATWMTALLAGAYKVPWIAVGHGTEFGLKLKLNHLLTRWSFSRASAVVCVSNYTRTRMQAAGIRARRTAVIPNGADPGCFGVLPPSDVHTFRESLGLGDSKLLLTVGQVSERKGQEVVIRALQHIVKRSPKHTLPDRGTTYHKERTACACRATEPGWARALPWAARIGKPGQICECL